MQAFFDGWRRKSGVVMLVMACLFTAGLIRSQFAWDGVTYFTGKQRTDSLYSRQSAIGWGKALSDSPDPTRKLYTLTWGSARVSKETAKKADFVYPDPDVHWRWYGFERSEMSINGVRLTMCEISYWYFITPFTLVSAVLLLSKSHTSHQTKTPEPIPVELG